jgi:HSP20 family protein
MPTTTPVTVKKATPSQNGIEPWRSFRSEMDRLFDRFANGFGLPSVEPFWPQDMALAAPAVDISEDDKAYTVTAELPGIQEKDIDVSVSNGVLTLKGEKRQEKEEKDKNHYLSERSYGSFQRSFTLPDNIDQDKISAAFAKGVLTVSLPKTAEAQKTQKKIEVKAA